MRTKTVEKWVWILIYAGLLAVALGVAVRDAGGAIAAVLVALGVAAVVLGAGLIWWRSRMADPPPEVSGRHDPPV